MRAGTPVSSSGRVMWSGMGTCSRRSVPLNQWTRNRFRGSASSGSIPPSRARIPSGIVSGFASCANVGRRMRASLNRAAVRS